MSFDDYFYSLIRMLNYSLKCSTMPIQTQGCTNFWIGVYVVITFVVSLVFLYAIRNILRERAEFTAYEKRKLERAKVADAETMKKVQWQPNEVHEDIDQADLALKMRQQINADKAKRDK